MDLDPNGTGNDILFPTKLGKDLLLHLHIVFHQVRPRLDN
jgi:hypothetical protein